MNPPQVYMCYSYVKFKKKKKLKKKKKKGIKMWVFPFEDLYFKCVFKLCTFYHTVVYLERDQLEADYLHLLPCRLATNLDLLDWLHEVYPLFEKTDLTLDMEHKGHLMGRSQNEPLRGSKQ